MPPQLFVCILLKTEILKPLVQQELECDRYQVTTHPDSDAFFRLIEQEKHQIDCLVLEDDAELPLLVNRLHGQGILLPAVIVLAEEHGLEADEPASPTQPGDFPRSEASFTYHTAEARISQLQLGQIAAAIEQAIEQFLDLSPACRLGVLASAVDRTQELTTQNFLLLQQRRLHEKLKERLGYLGVYYKRSSKNFLRYMAAPERQAFLATMKMDYRGIVLRYFADDGSLNQRIDDFVNTAFFSDVAVSHVVEIHMELMDEFSKQLKLEGRSDDILLDYRLTLIDTIAHLCEMYRRSIPRELERG